MKDECLSKLILFSRRALRTTLREYVDPLHGEHNHQGKDNFLLFPTRDWSGPILLMFYHRAAA